MKNKIFLSYDLSDSCYFFISAVTGLCINSVRSDGVPLIGDWSVQSQVALLNVVILAGASAFIIYEAICQFQNPALVSGKLIIMVAL